MSAKSINHSKAKVGALSRSRGPNDPDLIDARRSLAAAKLETYVQKIVAEAPPLTSEQLDRISALLLPSAVRDAA